MASKLDKKEISVSKLPEDVDKATFRQWIDSIDLSLEITHGWKLPNLLLNHVRRAKVAVDAEVLANCITKANEDFFKMQREMKIEPKDGDDIDQVLDYPFHERTTYLNAYLVSKLNSNLHDKTVGVEHRNGFELYRQVCQIVDAVPENASFHMKNEITGLTKTYGPKVTDLSRSMASDCSSRNGWSSSRRSSAKSSARSRHSSSSGTCSTPGPRRLR